MMTAPTRAMPMAMDDLRDDEFDRMRTLIHECSGISLHESKRALLVRRLNGRIRELGLSRMGAYREHVLRDTSGAELVRMLDLVTTNETHFFREPKHFELLAQNVFPAWRAAAQEGRRERRVRVWSAACSTGQEPYSIAMQLLTHLPVADGWDVEVLATDLSTNVLRLAEAGVWNIDKAKEIPPAYLKRYMLRGVEGQTGLMRATEELKSVVRFGRVNLNELTYPVPGSFDLIFCRNVLIYFSPERRNLVIERLAQRLTPGGLLFVGHAESLQGNRGLLTPVMPTVYALGT